MFHLTVQEPMGYGPEYLVCPIRAEDILENGHPDSVLTPVGFYCDIADLTGLKMVFVGQTHPNAYMDRISAAFPNAIFRAPQDKVLVDFETIRQSRNVVIGVWTYSWLAAWLSRRPKTSMSLSTACTTRCRTLAWICCLSTIPGISSFFSRSTTPSRSTVTLRHIVASHAIWRQLSHDVLRQQFATAPRFRRDLEQALTVLDERYYLDSNADVAAVAREFAPSFARVHFQHHGFQERRSPLRFDPCWYAGEYPIAAFEVAQATMPISSTTTQPLAKPADICLFHRKPEHDAGRGSPWVGYSRAVCHGQY